MIENRTGLFGNYYGSPYTSSASLTEEQMKVNARYIYNALTNDGWTIKDWKMAKSRNGSDWTFILEK